MKQQKDSNGNVYFDVGDKQIRVTADPDVYKGGNHKGINIRRYQDNGKLHMHGAALAIPNKETAFELINAIVSALDALD